MTFDPDRPLQLPADRAVYVPRRLQRYSATAAAGAEVTDQQLLGNLLNRQDKNYAILSARGTGKTSLLNWIAYQVKDESSVLFVGPIDLSACREHRDLAPALEQIQALVISSLQQRGPGFHVPQLQKDIATHFGANLQALLEQARSAGHATRVLLLLDNFQELHPRVAFPFSARLRDFWQGYGRATIVLTGEQALAELVQKEWSPLRGIMEEYTLLDFTREEIESLARVAYEQGLRFEPEVVEAIFRCTHGYPYLVAFLFKNLQLQFKGQKITKRMLGKAVLPWLKGHDVAPFEAAYQTVLDLATGFKANRSPLDLLCGLLDGNHKAPGTADHPGAEVLILRGIVRRGPGGRLDWRNPAVRCHMRACRQRLAHIRAILRHGESALRGHGWICVSLALDLRRYVHEEDKLRFDQLRGTTEYVEALRKLAEKVQKNGPGPFRVRRDEERLRNIGADLGIFRHDLVQHAFMPIYEVVDTKSWFPFPSKFQELLGQFSPYYEKYFKEQWGVWKEASVQLTRDGTVHIRLQREMGVQPLPEWVRYVLVLGQEISPETVGQFLLGPENWVGEARKRLQAKEIEGRSVQWEMATGLVERFIGDVLEPDPSDSRFHRFPGLEGIRIDKSGPRQAGAPIYPEHDRHVIFAIDQLCDCNSPNGRRQVLPADKLAAPLYAKELACLLEGVMVEDQEKISRFPPLKKAEAFSVLKKDLSSWEGELCLIGGENTVLYFQTVSYGEPASQTCLYCQGPLKEQIHELFFSQRQVRYEDYWRCIIRGLEYLLDLRLLGRLVAAETTRYVAKMAETMADKSFTRKETKEIERLRQQLTTMARLLSHLRDASIPRFIGAADYATRKFEHFIETSGLRATIEHAGRNIQEANALQQHYETLNDQQADRERSAILAVIAALFSLLSLASFLIDWQSFAKEMHYSDAWLLIIRRMGIAVVFIGLGVAVFVLLNAWWGVRIKHRMAGALAALSKFWRTCKGQPANDARGRPRGRRKQASAQPSLELQRPEDTKGS